MKCMNLEKSHLLTMMFLIQVKPSTSTQVIRVGQFNAVANSTYLRFIPEEQALGSCKRTLQDPDQV